MGLDVAMARMSMEKGGAGGRVVVVSSTCGVTCQGDMFATPAYTASKHAVTALTRTMGVRPLATINLLPAAQVLGGEDGGVCGGGGPLLHRCPRPPLLLCRHPLPGGVGGLDGGRPGRPGPAGECSGGEGPRVSDPVPQSKGKSRVMLPQTR